MELSERSDIMVSTEEVEEEEEEEELESSRRTGPGMSTSS